MICVVVYTWWSNTSGGLRCGVDLQTNGLLLHDDSGFELFEKTDNTSLPISGRYHATVMTSAIRSVFVFPSGDVGSTIDWLSKGYLHCKHDEMRTF